MDEKNASVRIDKPPSRLSLFWLRGKWAILGIGTVIAFGAAYGLITTPSLPGWTNFNDKGLWDVLSLIIVPLALVVVAYLFNRREKETELEIARKERESEQRIAKDREEEQALQSYFDRMSELLLERNLRKSEKDSEERSIARSRTLTTLRRLNPERKAALLLFLYESKLIDKDTIVVSLSSADLMAANLQGARLEDANLQGVNLQGASLQDANLERANLKLANLENANLLGARLEDANLWAANLQGASLQAAILVGAILERTNLQRARLEEAYLQRANLMSAYLMGTILQGAILQDANLERANLERANLQGAYLLGANLQGASLVNVHYDESTTWPDGFTPPGATPLVKPRSSVSLTTLNDDVAPQTDSGGAAKHES